MLPNFLGIGVPRAGTTWLHELLSSHPQVYVPTQRKEIHYFDRYYDRSLDWYERFFPGDEDSNMYRAVGEISPEYIFSRDCLGRIADVPSIRKFILMLRNPIDRAYSFYGLKVRNTNYRGSFDDFLVDQPAALGRGYYSRYIENFCDIFDREQLLVMISESAVADIVSSKATLGRFLDVDPTLFPSEAGKARVNPSYIPRAPKLYSMIVTASKKLRRWDGLTDFVKRVGVKRWFRTSRALPPISRETRYRLQDVYADEIDKLERLIDVNLDCWRIQK